MTEAYIYDAVRTPRGKGRKDGSLHEVTPVRLAVTALQALAARNKLDTHLVDDVVLGCVMPIGEQGADIARTAAVVAGYAETVPGVQVNRFCASGLEATNMAAAQGRPIRPWRSRCTSCRRASRPTLSPPSMASAATTSTPTPSNRRSAPRR